MSKKRMDDDWTDLDQKFKELLELVAKDSPDLYGFPSKGVDYSFLCDKKGKAGEKCKGSGKSEGAEKGKGNRAPKGGRHGRPNFNVEFGGPDEFIFTSGGNLAAERGGLRVIGGRDSSPVHSPPTDMDMPRVHINDTSAKKKRFFGFHNRLGRIVACVALFFVTASDMAIYINSQPANASKFAIEKKFYEIRDGLFSTDNGELPDNPPDETSIVRKYTSMDDIDKAKKFMPELLVPEYIPVNFKLESLNIEKSANDLYNAGYIFKNQNKYMYINILAGDEVANSGILSDGKIVLQGEREICIWADDATESYGCSFLIGDALVTVTGEISQDEMLKVSEQII